MPDRMSLFPGWRGFLVVGVVLLTLDLERAGADESQYTLEEITKPLKDWEAKIRTLRVHTKTVCDPYAKMAVKAGLSGIERIGYDDWIWTKAGPHRHHHWTTYNGRPRMRSIQACDDYQSWRAHYDKGYDESDPSQVNLSSISPNSQGPQTPLTGLWRTWGPATSGIWLGEAIKRGELELVGVDELDGRQCVLFRHPVGVQRPDGPLNENFWLDPEHGFLPVQVETPLFSKYTVEEFFEPEPGFFFPKRGRFLHRHDGVVEQAEEWEITAVELNQTLPAALWIPPVVKTKAPDLAEKAAAKGQAVRELGWFYALRMTELDFWLEGGFLAITVALFMGVLLLWLFKRRKPHTPTGSPPQ